MNGLPTQLERVLVVHSNPDTRRSAEETLRRIGPVALTIYTTGSLSDAAQKARMLDPVVILLGLDESTELALDLARELRRPDRLLIGLYNPIVIGQSEGDLLRAATRAGISDFAAVPISDQELAAAIGTSPLLGPAPDIPPEGQTFGFFSIKGGAGCTTAALNTAVALAGMGHESQVVLLDGDISYGTVCHAMGIVPDRDVVDLALDLDHPGPLDAYAMRDEASGLLVLPSARTPSDAERVTPDDLCRIVLATRRRFRFTIIDVPSRLDYLTLSLLDLCDLVYVLAEPLAPTVSRTAQLLRLLQDQGFGPRRLRLILNRQDRGAEGLLSERVVSEQLGRSIDLVIPYERRAADALNRAVPLVSDRPRSGFAHAVQDLARQLSARQPERA